MPFCCRRFSSFTCATRLLQRERATDFRLPLQWGICCPRLVLALSLLTPIAPRGWAMFPYFETGVVVKLGSEPSWVLIQSTMLTTSSWERSPRKVGNGAPLGVDPKQKAHNAEKATRGQKPIILRRSIKRPVFAASRAMFGVIGNSFPAIWAILPTPRS